MDTLTPLTPLTILAVEDNPADIYTVKWVLTAHALTYDLQVIENADQAFSFFDQLAESEHTQCPDILLLDLNLPQRNGKELLQPLKAIPACAAMRVVILTSSRDPADRAETLGLGADVFFEKPFHLTDFIPLGAIIKTLAVSHASVQTPEQASRARLAQSARLHQESARLRQESARLRQESKALVDRVQVLCDKSLHLLQKAAMLSVKPKV
jgi:chemotaxis family two-component system response regulator Rcp1